MKTFSAVLAVALSALSLAAAAQSGSTTQAPGTPQGGALSTKSPETVNKVKAEHQARKASAAHTKQNAPGDVWAASAPKKRASSPSK